MLPNDLKQYHAEVDAFQILDEGTAAFAFLVLLGVCVNFWPYIK